MSAAGADVDFCILNNCEWYPAATVQTDASGMAALTCGLGSLRLLARRDGLCCEAFVSPEETGPVVLTLGKRAPAPDRWEPIELTAPAEEPARAVPTEPQRDLQERWLRQAHEAWYAAPRGPDAQGLPPEETALLRAGAGHAAQLAAFFLREVPEAMPLLGTLYRRDLSISRRTSRAIHGRTRPGRTACRKASGRPLCSVRASDLSSFCRSGGVIHIFRRNRRCVSQGPGALGMAHGDDRAVRAQPVSAGSTNAAAGLAGGKARLCLRRSAVRSASRPGLRRRTARPNIGTTASGSARGRDTR